MTVLTRELKASYAFVERNFNLTKRYWGWEVALLVYSVAGALSVTLIGERPGQRAAAPVADDRRDLLELPVDRLRVHRRAGRLGALGGHARVHVHGAGPALCRSCSARPLFAIVYGLIHTDRRAGRAGRCSSGSTCRSANFVTAGVVHAPRLALASSASA